MNEPRRLIDAWPAGAIRTPEQMLELVIEARKEKKAIRLISVNQSGSMQEHYLYSKSRYVRNKDDETGLCVGPNFDTVNVYVKSGIYSDRKPSDRYYKDEIFMGSYGIAGDLHTVHRLFQNHRLAEQYSDQLKNDAEYMQSVKDWHAHCARTFSWDF